MADESTTGSTGKNYFTPKNILIYLLVGALVYGLVYFLFMRNNTATEEVATEEVEEEVVDDEFTMTIDLASQNDSGQTGIATLTEGEDGMTTVLVELDTAPEGVEQPAHIHTGACPAPGEVTYPLTNVVDGVSETVLEVDMATLREQLPLALNVHKSAEEASVYVSCGDLTALE